MASTKKKTSASGTKKRASSSASKSGGKRTSAASGSGKRQQAAAKPIRREVGSVVCLLLAFLSAVGYFNVDGFVINYFCMALKGLFGYGFWLVPPMLLVASYILGFHRGRPVRLRLTCALLLPVLVGALLHMFLAPAQYTWSVAMFPHLWKDGVAMVSGGVVSGTVGVGLVAALSRLGASIVLIVLCILMLLECFDYTIVDVADRMRERRDNRPEYVEEELPEPDPRKKNRPERPSLLSGRARAPAEIDIPVDDGPAPSPVPEKKPTVPVTGIRKKNLFERSSRVPAPDEVLTGQSAPQEADRPEYEAAPGLEPMEEISAATLVTQPEPAVSHAPAAAAAPVSPAPQEKMPEIVREPAVKKVTAGEAAAAAAAVSREAAGALDKDHSAYRYPPLSLLKESTGAGVDEAQEELQANEARLSDTIHSFGVDAHMVNVTRGPSVTRYELELDQGVKLNKITNLSDDIALALGAQAVRIAPIPDKISTVGIEVPNKSVTSVGIRDVIGSKAFCDSSSKVTFSVGKDIAGNCIVCNISKLPHLLIAGTTGSGKSVCTNSLIVSLLYKSTPDEVRLIMVDPKMVELGVYNGIPHLLIPVVTDPKKAAGALQWAVNEMMKRYRVFSEIGAKDLASYNNHARKRDDLETMPQIVVVIDELADLMLVAAKEVEESICRVAQMGRAAGMHLIIATQRPSADVITGLMKANIPSRIAFAVASSLESRIILDTTGAEKLVGKGDMLYFPLGSGKPQRVQGCFISEEEVAGVVDFIKQSGTAQYDEEVLHEIERHAEEKDKSAKGVGGSSGDDEDYDELLPAAIDVVLEVGQASVSMLQRRLKLGYGRAARLVDQMEEKGVVGPFEGSKPRQLLITKEQWQEMQYRQGMVDSVPASAYAAPSPAGDPPDQEDPDPEEPDDPPFDEEEP